MDPLLISCFVCGGKQTDSLLDTPKLFALSLPIKNHWILFVVSS